MNFDDVRTFFREKLLNARVEGVSSINVTSENAPFDVGQKPVFVDFRVAPTKTTTFSDKKHFVQGVCVYCVCTRPNTGTTALESVSAGIFDIFDPLVGVRSFFNNVPTGWRLIVRSVESLPSYLIDKLYKKNIRISFDLMEN